MSETEDLIKLTEHKERGSARIAIEATADLLKLWKKYKKDLPVEIAQGPFYLFYARMVKESWRIPSLLNEKTNLNNYPDGFSAIVCLHRVVGLPQNQVIGGFDLFDKAWPIAEPEELEGKEAKFLGPDDLKQAYILLGGDERKAEKMFSTLQ